MVFDRKLGKSFRKTGEAYHLGRRDYPKRLVEDIIEISGIGSGSLILDAGCGTGKSMFPFAQKRYEIVGIDTSEKMLKVARSMSSGYKNVRYVKASFEKARLAPNSFDLVLAGTSMHWLDPNVAYRKAHSILREGGHIAIFWEPVMYLDRQIRKLRMREIFLRNCPNYPRNPKKNAIRMKVERGLMNRKLFYKPIIKTYPSARNYSKEEFCNLINTYSWILSMDRKKRARLMQEIRSFLDKKEDPIRVPTEFYLVIAKRK